MLAGGAIAVLISACGGASAEPDSIRTASPSNSARSEGGQEGDRRETSRDRPHSTTEAGSDKVGTTGSEAGGHPKGTRKGAASTQEGVDGCSASMGEQQCAEAGEAYKQAKKGGSHTVKANECPQALSRSACKEAGEASQQAGEGHVVKPDECPAAMTDQQCAEAGQAYQEATK